MVLIISSTDDYSTKDVIDWLIFYNQPFLIINPEDKVEFKFELENYFLIFENYTLNIDQISSVWYRRGWLNLAFFESVNGLENIIYSEFIYLRDFIYFLLQSKKHINKRSDNEINKLITLKIAEKNGFNVPKSFFNIYKDELQNFELITKTISGSSSLVSNGKTYLSYTRDIDIAELKNNYSNSYLQEKINKKYELRVFFLHGKVWSMAIFSQNDAQTQTDFRKYNRTKPNRFIPYSLPANIKTKIDGVMSDLNINSGSIDLIVSQENEYYFLEVNPIGQFGMVSYPCNYYLEEEIAKFLKNEK